MSKGDKMNRRSAFCGTLVLLVVVSLIAVIPQQIFAQTKKGIELYNLGKYQEAESVLREALKTDSKDTAANYYLGLSVLEQKKYSDALDIFLEVKKSLDRGDQQARPAVPSEYQIQLAMGRARLGLKQYDEAWKNIESARTEDSASSEVYMYRGVYYLQQEEHEEAVKDLEKAISLDANNAYAYYYAGLAYYAMGNGKKAAEDLGTFIQMAPDAPEAEKAREIRNLC
jgi:tetratricopeptide (TPR) repeat protein